MQDLNDLAFFHAVATHHGFSAAARATGLPKATLSKRVALLEERLGIRLLERSLTPELFNGIHESAQGLSSGAFPVGQAC